MYASKRRFREEDRCHNLSTNFAGSHFPSLMLGSHSRAQHVGEVRRLHKRPRTKQPCFLCEASGECELFRDIDADGLEDLWPTLLSRVEEKILVLIDNSKKPSWAARFLADDRHEKKYIHLVRDPRALIRRWATDYAAWPKRIEQRVTWLRRRPDLLSAMLLASHATANAVSRSALAGVPFRGGSTVGARRATRGALFWPRSDWSSWPTGLPGSARSYSQPITS